MTEDDALHRLYQGAIIAEGRGHTELATSMIDLAEAIERAAGRMPSRALAALKDEADPHQEASARRLPAPLLWLRRHIA